MSQAVICLDSDDDCMTVDPPKKKKRITPIPVIQDQPSLVVKRIMPIPVIQEEPTPTVTAEEASEILTECTLTPIPKSESKENFETVIVDSDEEMNINCNSKIKKVSSIHCTKNNAIESDNKSDSLDLGLEPINNSDERIEFVNLDEDDDSPMDNLPSKSKESFNDAISTLKLNSTKSNSIEFVSLSDESEQEDADQIVKNTQNETEVQSQLNGVVSETVSLDGTDSEDEKLSELNNLKNSDSSIVIADSDTESREKEKENDCKNGQVNKKNKDKILQNLKEIPSTSKEKDDNFENKTQLKKFLKLVKYKVSGSQFERGMLEKIPLIEKYFFKCGDNSKNKSLTMLLNDTISKTEYGTAATAVIGSQKLLEHLKLLSGRVTIAVEEDHVPMLKKLEKTIKLLTKKIKQLEESEIDFDDDEDSTYIQADKYQKRLNKVYSKYCRYIKKNPHSGRITHDKINFCNSNYNEINLAINRKYKNSLKFPSYCELENCIDKVSKTEHLNLSESEIKFESARCFKELGRILQKRRKTELYDCHVDFIQNTEDPASKDIHLENTLKKNFVEGESRIERLCQKYSAKQELGEDKVSTSPGSSDYSDEEQPT